MLKKISLILALLVVVASLSACSGLTDNQNESSTSATEETIETVDWTQGIAPEFTKEPTAEHSFGTQKLFNQKEYVTSTASFDECTEADFDDYIALLVSNGFSEDSENGTSDIKYFFDKNQNMVVVGMEDGCLSVTVGKLEK